MAEGFIPMESGAESLMSMPELTPLRAAPVGESQENPPSVLPRGLEGLPYTGTLSQLMNVSLAVQMGLPVAGLEAEVSRKIFVQQFQRYAWVREGKQRVMYGVGIRWLVDLRQLDFKFQVSPSLPMLTAAAQLGYLNATVRFDTIGLISKEIDAAIPAPTVLSVETHAEYAAALKRIMALMWDKETTVVPQPLSQSYYQHDQSEGPLVDAWVVQQIALGRTLRQATELLRDPSDSARDRVRAAYEAVVGKQSEDQVPPGDVVENAKLVIRPFPFTTSK